MAVVAEDIRISGYQKIRDNFLPDIRVFWSPDTLFTNGVI